MQQHTFTSSRPAEIAFDGSRRVRFSARRSRSTVDPRALKRTLHRCGIAFAIAIFASASALRAQPATQPATTAPTTRRVSTGPSVEKLMVHPSAVTQPLLQYKLLPDIADQTPGDAVPLYLMTRNSGPDAKTDKEILAPENGKYDYLDTPASEFPPQYAQRLFDGYARRFAYVDVAARRREAHWDVGWREFGFAEPLSFDYLNALRHNANLLGFRGRYQIAHNDWAGADYTLQSMFGMARHIGNEPLQIHAMVEYGLAEITLWEPIWDWIGHSGSPNLYWPLTDLPHPFVDPRLVVQSEKLYSRYNKSLTFQALRGELPADQWPAAIREMVYSQQDHKIGSNPQPEQVDAQVKLLIDSCFARARDYLLAHGEAASALASMSREQVVGRYWCREYQRAHDDLWKYWALDYPQASQNILETWRSLAPDRSPALDNPLIQDQLVPNDGYGPVMDFPILLRARNLLARTDRHIAMFRIVEAMRDYAAHHGGLPPERLDQITDLPIPLDPITGKEFSYHVEGQTAILEALAPPLMAKSSGRRLELTFVK
ncbi:MAG TPA: hypothetical protein VH370_09325 [Humisphaera sp.]|nr:hypothetical protein [Humisphaera sp.]